MRFFSFDTLDTTTFARYVGNDYIDTNPTSSLKHIISEYPGIQYIRINYFSVLLGEYQARLNKVTRGGSRRKVLRGPHDHTDQGHENLPLGILSRGGGGGDRFQQNDKNKNTKRMSPSIP